ncbi:MAG: hypothetical protein Q4G13_05400 [Moraxella sp.]|nr:hypothetical protein [Moraxella sp.]
MLTLEKFEQLVGVDLPPKETPMSFVGAKGELMDNWLASLPHLNKHEQYKQIKTVLSELVVANIDDNARLAILEKLPVSIDRLVGQLHHDYIYDAQNSLTEQQACIDEVRSLYFLSVLCYQGVAVRAYQAINATNTPTKNPKKSGTKLKGWLNNLSGGLGGSVVSNGLAIDLVGGPRRLLAIAIYRMMTAYYQLLMEFALVYRKAPNTLWREMNLWFLRAVSEGVDKVPIGKLLKSQKEDSIYLQYAQSCMASFTNLFAYRRQDILNIFKILPKWVLRLNTSFEPVHHLKVFVNLQGDLSPEIITPNASINPYSKAAVCLFFDFAELFEYLVKIEQDEASSKNIFEARLAKMVKLTFERQAIEVEGRVRFQEADFLRGFGSVFKEMANDRSFNQIIRQAELAAEYHPKKMPSATAHCPKETVRVFVKSDMGVRFFCGETSQEDKEEALNCPYLQAFGLFAIKSQASDNQHPWRLGIVHWVEHQETRIEVDGRFLGRILSVCGIRLLTHDMRSKDFVQALLIAGDELNQQTTLVIPRYHFKESDTVILRVDNKETTLRLDKKLLATDDIEQYQIVRLSA